MSPTSTGLGVLSFCLCGYYVSLESFIHYPYLGIYVAVFPYRALLWRICNKMSCNVQSLVNLCGPFCFQWFKMAFCLKHN